MTLTSLSSVARATIAQILLGQRHGIKQDEKNSLMRQLESDSFHPVSESLLDYIVSWYPKSVTDNIIATLTPSHIKELKLKDCTSVTAVGILKVFKKCRYLQSLDLSGCNDVVSAKLFEVYAMLNNNIKSLSLEGCDNVNDDVVHAIIKNYPRLEHVNLSMCENITDNAFLVDEMKQLGQSSSKEYMSCLSSVDISGCRDVTSAFVRHLTSLCGPHLRTLNIAWTDIDVTVLWFLSGYSLSTAVHLAMEVDREHQEKMGVTADSVEKLELKSDHHEQTGLTTDENLPGRTKIDRGTVMSVSVPSDVDFSSTNVKVETSFKMKHFNTDVHSQRQSLHWTCSMEKELKWAFKCTSVEQHEVDKITVSFDTSNIANQSDGVTLTDFDQTSVTENPCSSLHSGFGEYQAMLPAVELASPGTNSILPHSSDSEFTAAEGHLESSMPSGKFSCTLESDIILSCNDKDENIESTESGAGEFVGPQTGSEVASSRVNCVFQTDDVSVSIQSCKPDAQVCSESYASNPDVVLQESGSSIGAEVDLSSRGLNSVLSPSNKESSSVPENEGLGLATALHSGVDCSEDFVFSIKNELECDSVDCVSSEDVQVNGIEAPADMVQLYQPNITSLDISNIEHSSEHSSSCLKAFFMTNKNLTKFSISWKDLEDEMVTVIADSAPCLRCLSLVDCELMSVHSASYLGLKCRLLQQVDLKGDYVLSDAAIHAFLTCTSLTSLGLAECSITDVTLERMAEKIGHQLKKLDLSWCEDITSVGLDAVAQACPSLQYIDLRHCAAASSTLALLADHCPSLHYLGLSSVDGITDEDIVQLAKSLTFLQTLDISWNPDLTNVSVEAVLQCCPHLKEFYLSGIKQLTSVPFLPIISDLNKWRRCQNLLRFKFLERKSGGEETHSSDEEYEDLWLPHRSTCFAPGLRYLDLEYCDKVTDTHLAEIVAVCRGSLSIRDYHAEMVEPAWVSLKQGKVLFDPVKT